MDREKSMKNIEKFIEEARSMLDSGTLPLTKIGCTKAGYYYIPQDIIDYYHEALDLLKVFTKVMKVKKD